MNKKIYRFVGDLSYGVDLLDTPITEKKMKKTLKDFQRSPGFTYAEPSILKQVVLFYKNDLELAGFVLASDTEEGNRLLKEWYAEEKAKWQEDVVKDIPHYNIEENPNELKDVKLFREFFNTIKHKTKLIEKDETLRGWVLNTLTEAFYLFQEDRLMQCTKAVMVILFALQDEVDKYDKFSTASKKSYSRLKKHIDSYFAILIKKVEG